MIRVQKTFLAPVIRSKSKKQEKSVIVELFDGRYFVVHKPKQSNDSIQKILKDSQPNALNCSLGTFEPYEWVEVELSAEKSSASKQIFIQK